MDKRISSMLEKIEQEENVTILHCVESGSRAWGFPSPNSDYDVRFVYLRKPDDYLKLEKTRDVIQRPLDETLDISGWDLQKTLRLLQRSNPTVFEWNASPIIYKTTQAWSKMQPLLASCFSKKKCMHHYLGMARSSERSYLRGETVRVKKYLYALRSLLACHWILVYGTPPPVALGELTEACLPRYLQDEVLRLIELKNYGLESAECARIPLLSDYMSLSIQWLTKAIEDLPDEPEQEWRALDEAFRSQIHLEEAS